MADKSRATIGAKLHTSPVKISGGRVRPSNYAELSRLASLDANQSFKVTKGPSKIATGTGPNRIYNPTGPPDDAVAGASTAPSPVKINVSSAAASVAASSASAPQNKILQEYTLRVPKNNVKPISLMRFNGPLNVDVAKWTSVKMQREDNSRHQKVFNFHDDDAPKFGAGSEYGREAREEARRRKYGGNRKKIVKEDQPWLLKLGDKINRKYKGIRDGGLTQNASYFIFTQAADGAFEVFPVQQWYNFSLIQSYKCLSAEEAEEEFGRRNKIMNYFSLMVKKRMQIEDDGDDGEKTSGKVAGKKTASSSLKVSEMDDWEDSDKEEDSDTDEKDEKDDSNKKKKKQGMDKKKKKKKKKDSDDEAFEDSDDGDGEGRELDYISDTSETEDEEEADKKNDQKGVDEAASEEESSEEENKEVKEEKEKEDEPGPSSKEQKVDAEQTDKKKKKKKKKKSEKKDAPGAAVGEKDEIESKYTDDFEDCVDQKMESGSSGNNSGNSRDGTPDLDGVAGKRKAPPDSIGATSGSLPKKQKLEMSTFMLQSASSEGITEDAVRRYLARKPMTATELLQKFKSKKTKISSQDMVNVIAHLLKKINPVKRMQNQKMYLFLSDK